MEARGLSQVSWSATLPHSLKTEREGLIEPGAMLSLPFHTSRLTGQLLLASNMGSGIVNQVLRFATSTLTH